VFAAGDATNFPIKHGGIAAQQAETAAAAIAALAGAPVEPRPLDPVIHAILLGGDRPLHLSAHFSGSVRSKVSETPLWRGQAKIDARRLTPYLDGLDRAGQR
jgi:sulfide:quinone oxidoreductase